MNVLLMIDRMEAGGAETHVETLARKLAEEMRKTGGKVGIVSEGGAIVERMRADGEKVKIHRMKMPGKNPAEFLAAARELREMVRAEGYNVLHAHTRRAAALARTMQGKRLPDGRRIHIVVTCHAAFRWSPMLGIASCWGERTIAVSEDLREMLIKRYHTPAEQITVIPNGVDTDRFHPGKPPEKRENAHLYAKKDHEKSRTPDETAPVTVLFVSRMDEDCAKGAELLCRIAARLQTIAPARILLVGGGNALPRVRTLAETVNRNAPALRTPEKNRKKQHQSTEKHALYAKNDIPDVPLVTVCGAADDLPQTYRKADVFVGVSRAAMEAAASGCAVILCGNEGYGGILTAGRDDLAAGNFCCRGLPQADENNLCTDLCRLLANPTERKRIANGLRDWMTRDFSAKQTAKMTLSVYRAACGESETACERVNRPAPRKNDGSSPGKPIRICIAGYAGCGNLGDDAIAEALIPAIRKTLPGTEITLLCGVPNRDKKRFFCRCVGRKNPFSVIRAIRQADLFLLGGGSLLQNASGRFSPFYYLALLQFARLSGCKIAVYAAGIGPIRGEFTRDATARALLRCQSVSLREPPPAWLLRHAPALEFRLSADPTFLLSAPPRYRSSYLRERLFSADFAHLYAKNAQFRTLENTKNDSRVTPENVPEHTPNAPETGNALPPQVLSNASSIPDFFCVSVRPASSDCPELLANVTEAVRLFSLASGWKPVWLTFDTIFDTAPTKCAQTTAGGRIADLCEPSDALALLSTARFALSMRLHGLLLSVRVGTPCAAIPPSSSDTKLASFASSVPLPVLAPDRLSVSSLLSVCRTLADASFHDASLARSPLPDPDPVFSRFSQPVRENRENLSRFSHPLRDFPTDSPAAFPVPSRADLLACAADFRKKAGKDLANLAAMVYNGSR